MSIPDLARRRGAHIVFIDEAGFMLAPLVCRTWAPRGCTPTIKVADDHARISVIGAISVSPTRRCFRFHYRLLADNLNFHDTSVLQFVESLRCRLRGPITLLWDQIPIHRSARVHSYFNKHRRLVVEPFPAYAPELNPVDYVWAYVKRCRLGNYCPGGLEELRKTLHSEFQRLKNNTPLLRSFFNATGLESLEPCTVPLRRTQPRKGSGYRKRQERRFVVFDTETVDCLPMSSANPKISCAATMVSGQDATIWHSGKQLSRPARCLAKPDAVRLVEYLSTLKADGYTIVTWNGAGFDFRGLAHASGMLHECKALAIDHIDMMFHVLCAVGFGVSLDAAAHGLNIVGKRMQGRDVPAMWASGNRAEVIEYLKNDVALTMRIAMDCHVHRQFAWMTQAGRRRILKLPSGWRTVQSAARMKHNHVRWNNCDWSREQFIGWLGKAHTEEMQSNKSLKVVSRTPKSLLKKKLCHEA